MRTVIITGANSGIGPAASHQLAAEGVGLVMACRNRERGQAARDAVVAATENPNVTLEVLDTSSLASVRAFA